MTNQHTWISWLITLVLYIFALAIISFLIKQEIDKRNHLTVLSWNGRITDLPAANRAKIQKTNQNTSNHNYSHNNITTNQQQNTNIKHNMSNNTQAHIQNAQYIEGSIHYLSYSVYFFVFHIVRRRVL